MTTNSPTPKQTFAIFCISGYDVRNCPTLTFDLASSLISDSKTGKDIKTTVAELPGAILKRKVNHSNKSEFEKIWAAAHNAGMLAGEAAIPTPMVVTQHANMADDNSPVQKQWYVSEGVCGFAWVVIRPGTCAFARWASKEKEASKHYYGGVSIWVGEFGQSMTRKEAYASAFAEVLQKHGINAHAGSRMD